MLEFYKKLARKMKAKNNKEYCVVKCSCGSTDVMELITYNKSKLNPDIKDKYTKLWATNDKD